jgi:hypothetical protein
MRAVNRDEFGDYADNFYGCKEYELPVRDSDTSFRGLFPRLCIKWEVIKDLYSYAEDVYEKIMAVCMALIVAAAVNPMMVFAITLRHSDIDVRVPWFLFLGGIILFVIISLLALNKSFSLIAIGVIAVLKAYPFSAAAADTFCIFLLTVIFFVARQMKKRSET